MERTHTDLAYLESFCKGDRSRMKKYIGMYLSGSPGLLTKLELLLVAGDAEGLAVAAHSLKPQVRYMGAQQMADLLTQIEQKARTQGAASCAAEVNAALSLNEKVITELQAELDAG